ncbi:hypothetical protein [Streptomyces similanensis]|uniref:hypothetical protein n=1 Tax=Streptomyces similanensis TaxID=1274988 RepID=UPI0031EC2919
MSAARSDRPEPSERPAAAVRAALRPAANAGQPDEAVLATETAPSRTVEPPSPDLGCCLDGRPSDAAPAVEPQLLPRRSILRR